MLSEGSLGLEDQLQDGSLMGCGQEASTPCLMGFSVGHLNVFMTKQLPPPPSK